MTDTTAIVNNDVATETVSALANNSAGADIGTSLLSSQFLIGSVGAPFLIGLAVGYFAKKTFKIALFIGGAALVALFAAEYYGVASISDEHLKNAASAAGGAVQHSSNVLMDRLSNISSKGLSAVAGFAAGLKFG
ncbi:MAG: FUN14 domain-containing protein [Pseudomonadota bacterium]